MSPTRREVVAQLAALAALRLARREPGTVEPLAGTIAEYRDAARGKR